uniref:Sulfatase n=1 Tax=Thermosporothrix sp. COM3 TaxID=2490863 RepID=A0A455SED4_9CHLR|nr:sulfatase [Thermosporothrix sp. COM3]
MLITSDQQHWNTLGRQNPEISTPNLDKLAEEGTTFTRAYCPNPTCTPSRASLITGKYPGQHGAWTLGTKLPETEQTVGELLGEAGYRTALVGKAHFQPLKGTEEYTSLEAYPILHDLAFWRDFHGPFYGFEHVELTRNHTNEAHVGQHYALWLEEKGCENWRDYFLPPTGRMDPTIEYSWPIPEEYHYDAWIAERTNALLEQYQQAGENFFLWASFFDPHPDYLAPEPWDQMYDPEKLTLAEVIEGEHERNPPHFLLTQQEQPDFSAYQESGFAIHGMHSHLREREKLKKDLAVYYGMISLMDKYIGKILQKLDELGLRESTIVVFTTDHGHLLGQHGLAFKGPFLYEDLLRVPMIVRYPGQVPAGVISTALQSLVDYAPTFLHFAGLPVPRMMSGKDQSQVWLGKAEKARDHVICEFRHEPTTINLRSYIDDRYKITIYYQHEYGELYDLKEDPNEVHNLWDVPEYFALKYRLLLKYAWAELEKEPLWMPRIANA